MRHARPETLDRIEPLLARIRERRFVKEKKRGIFYMRSHSMLHFHEDPRGIFADLRIGPEWVRFDVTAEAGSNRLLAALDSLQPSSQITLKH